MTRLAFTADLHADDLGSRVDPATGWSARFEDALTAVRFVGRGAVERGAEALVVAGDYTEHRSPSPPRVARIVEALQDGPARQIHVRGNHDQERSGRSIVDVLGQMPGWSGHTTPGIEFVGDVAICAIPFLSTRYLRSQPGFEAVDQADIYRALGEQYLTVARGLYAQAQELGAAAAILTGHNQLSGGRMTDAQAAFLGDLDLVADSRALAAIGYAAVVFGHVHRAQLVLDDPNCPVMFAGSIHRVDFAEAAEEKSFIVLDIEGGRMTHLERVPIPARRFVTLTAECGYDPEEIAGAVVRCIDVDPSLDVDHLRRMLEGDGAFEVAEIRRRPVVAPQVGGLAESTAPSDALAAYFDSDPDRDALIDRGRAVLAEVAP